MGKGEEIHDGEEWSTRKEKEVVGFPLAVSTIALAQVLGCSPYFMTSLALFSLSRLLLALALAFALTPILALALTLTSAS
jgi:hypothetical protein